MLDQPSRAREEAVYTRVVRLLANTENALSHKSDILHANFRDGNLSRLPESPRFQFTLKLLGLFSLNRDNRFVPPYDKNIHIAIRRDPHMRDVIEIDDDIFCSRDEFAHRSSDFTRRTREKNQGEEPEPEEPGTGRNPGTDRPLPVARPSFGDRLRNPEIRFGCHIEVGGDRGQPGLHPKTETRKEAVGDRSNNSP